MFQRLMKWLGLTPAYENPWSENDTATAVLEAPIDEQYDEMPDGEQPPELPGWWEPEGHELVIEAPKPSAMVDSKLHDQLNKVLRDPDLELPRIPRVIQQALSLIRDEHVSFKNLAELLEQDQAVSARLLRVANSARYRGIKQVSSLEHAFARLGYREIRSILLTAAAHGIAIRTESDSQSLGKELWQRSLASGVLVAEIGKHFHRPEDEAFMVGLLHDIGELAILRVMHDYQKMHNVRITRGLFAELSRRWHCHVGLQLANAWNLPSPLPELIGDHHSLPSDDDELRIYRLIIQASDAACALLNYGPFVPYDFFNLPCVRQLGLRRDPDTCEWLAALPEQIESRIHAF